jgi:hypothetical protein
MVDGAARPETVLLLSHWPSSTTPTFLARDLSVEIAFAFLDAARSLRSVPIRHRRRAAAVVARAESAEAVTCDHFDEDGLMSLLAISAPRFALERRSFTTEVARCGDFGVVRSEEAAAVAFAIAPLADLEAGENASASERYLAVLPSAMRLVDSPASFARLYESEMADFEESTEALRSGDVTLEEMPGDLAVVSRRSGGRRTEGRMEEQWPCHRAAIHSATECNRVLVFDGARCELYLRYESWVRYTTRRLPTRPDLGQLASELSALEPSGARWLADHPSATIPRLRPGGDGLTEIDPALVVRRTAAYLMRAPAC